MRHTTHQTSAEAVVSSSQTPKQGLARAPVSLEGSPFSSNARNRSQVHRLLGIGAYPVPTRGDQLWRRSQDHMDGSFGRTPAITFSGRCTSLLYSAFVLFEGVPAASEGPVPTPSCSAQQ